MPFPLLHARPLNVGDTVGVFTPSWPANVVVREKYLHGLTQLKTLGLQVVEGDLTKRAATQGYRSGTPQARAAELMALIRDPQIDGLIATIGGMNSSSLLPYLDFEEIRRARKVICGYSDVTSLHMAIYTMSGLSTFYGPAVMSSFGEWPVVLEETKASFWEAVSTHREGSRRLLPPARWSNHMRDGLDGSWKTKAREFRPNAGWKVLQAGAARGPIIIANLNTLCALAGTKYFPDLAGSIFIIEDMNAPLSQEERSLRQLELMGCFDIIRGLIVGKPERYDQQGAPFGYDELIREVVGSRDYPILSNFDCGHTNPMLTLAQGVVASLEAKMDGEVSFVIETPMVG